MEETTEESGVAFNCNDCGADLTYSPGTENISCQYCGADNEIAASTEEIKEEDFYTHLEVSSNEEKIEVDFVDCNTCGAASSLEANVTSADCPYCGSPFVVDSIYKDTILSPKSLIPFQLDKNQAIGEFKKWIGKSWFAPNDLKKADLNFEQFKGVYVPYWTYDADYDSKYSGSRGDYYYTTKTVRVGDKTTTQQVRQTRWTPTSGTVNGKHDDLLVVASNTLPKKYVAKLEPWDLTKLTPFDRNYLSGFTVEKYKVELDAGFEIAKAIGKPVIKAKVCNDIGGDTQQVSSMNTSYDNITFKHLLLPLYVCAYNFKGEVFQFLVNAQTGEVQGEKPKSWGKIILAILLVLILIGGAIVAVMYFRKESGEYNETVGSTLEILTSKYT
jgi:DNA-directed RNA polymerase subunit RPC12/RpoP